MTYTCLGSGSGGNCHVLKSDGGELLLLDCGLKIDEILRGVGWNTSRISGCLVTHQHGDHSHCASEMVRRGVRCFAPKECWEALGLNYGNAAAVKPHEAFRCGSFTAAAFRLHHDCECFGYLVRHDECGVVAYITDTMMCRERFSGVGHYIIEASYDDDGLTAALGSRLVDRAYAHRLVNTHQSLGECLRYLHAAAGIKTVVLCHISGNSGDPVSFTEAAEASLGVPCYAAAGGLEILL